MSEQIRINKTYAQRDINRMTSAATALDDAQTKYNEAIAIVQTIYKGEAANELVDVLQKNRDICKKQAENLRKAAKSLQNTINEYEATSKKLINIINKS